MLRFETAKLLKDHGFPQRKGGHDTVEHLKWGSPVYLCSHGNKCSNAYTCPESVYLPSLDHLVDVLGSDLEGFKRTDHGEIEAFKHREPGMNGMGAIAKSYREAAGLLFIALQGRR